jgi:hypothetical protein
MARLERQANALLLNSEDLEWRLPSDVPSPTPRGNPMTKGRHARREVWRRSVLEARRVPGYLKPLLPYD